MKKVVLLFALLAFAGTMAAQGPAKNDGKGNGPHARQAQRKFQILVQNETKAKTIMDTNNKLNGLQRSARGEAERGLLGDLLWQGISSSFTQKTVNATSNLLSLGISYATEALKSKREKWYRLAQQQCYYKQSLAAETKIDDFYMLHSTKGAMDPENLKFEGFGCKNYIEVGDSKEGVGVFYIFCKMRRDSIGLRHIINHSKFLVEIDSLIFNPKYCNPPNDSTGSADSRFSFEKRDNLRLELKTRFYSSWMNQAMMIANDQLLGEFTVSVEIDKHKLNADSVFVYHKNDPDYEKLVSINGDCFIVPRSYTGTTDGINFHPCWGTGQYRIEMEVAERCSIVDSYYQIRESGNGKEVAFADATPGKKRWDKAKWKVEWNAMNARRKGDSFFSNAWKCVVSAYKGSGWVATLTDPVTTALYSWETKKLGEWIDDIHKVNIPSSSTASGKAGTAPGASPAGAASGAATVPGASPSGNGIPKGDKPTGGKQQ